MALFKICKGAETNLPQTLTNGYCYFCTDTANFYIDYEDPYGALTRSKISAKYADKLRYTEDGNFVEIEPADVLTKNNYEAAIGVAATDKNGLMSSADKTKLDGIADGAEVNVQPDWNQNDETADDYIKNRPGGYYGDPVYGDIDIYNSTISNVSTEIENPGFSFVVGNVYTVTIGDVSNTYTAFAETFQGIGCVSIGEGGLNEAYSAGGTFAAGIATTDTTSVFLMICLPADVGKAIRITTSGITREAHKIPEDLLDLSEINTKIDVKIDEQSERCNKLQQDISDINSLLTTGPITFTNEKDQILIGEHYNRKGFTIKMINNDSGYTEFSRNGLYASYADEDNLSINVTKSVISIGSRNNGTISMEFAPTDSVHGGPYFFAYDGKGNSTYFSSSGKIVNSKKLLQLADADVDSNDKATTIRGVKIPEQDYDAANKKYVDDMAPTMVVNVTVTDGVYTADKTSQEIASAVVNNKKNAVAVLCNGSEYNTLRCSYAKLTDTTSESVFIVWNHDSKTRAIMTISNDGTSDSITVSTDPFTMTIGISQTTNEQGDAVYTSDYTADDIVNALSSHIVPVCMFENGDGLVFGSLSNYNASNGCFQFTSSDGSDCGVYYMNIHTNGNVEVGKTSIPTYTEATTTESGLMSASDKIKLDGIAENADDNVQSDWNQDTDTDDSYIKNKPFKTLSSDDFSVVDNTLSLSTTKLDSIKALGITGSQAGQFIKVSSVDSNGNPTAYSSESLDDKYISAIGGTYDLTNNITFTKSNDDTASIEDIYNNRVISFTGQPFNISGTNYIYTSGITHVGFSTIRNNEDGGEPVGSYFLPNVWQLLDDRIDGDHRKLYARANGLEFNRYNSGWKKFYIKAEKDRALIYNDQKLIDFNESILTNLGTPTNDTDAATKKYVDDLVPSEATTSASGLMSATDKVKLDGVASSAASVTIKTWTTADMV